jgi:MFS family permease
MIRRGTAMTGTPPASSREKLPREVVLLGWVSFFADVSSEMIYPLLPLFLVGVLGASVTSLGWIEGVAQAMVAVLTALAGWRSDLFRRRVPFVRWGYGLPVVGKAILATAMTWPMVLVGRTVDRIGKGIRSSPRDALIADSTSAGDRGRAFGLHRAMDTAGALVGVLVAAALVWWLTGSPDPHAPGGSAGDGRAFRIVFAISAAMGLGAVALTFLLREPRPARVDVRPSSEPAERGRWLGLPRGYWVAMVPLLVFSLANSSDTFLILRARDVGLAPWAVVVAYALYNLIYTVASYPAGTWSDRFGRRRVIGAGWVIYAGAYAGFALTNATSVWPLLAAYGLYMALTDGVGKALIADHAPAERRGLALGVFYMCTGAITLISNVVAGLLWDVVGAAATFWFGAAVALVAVLVLAVTAGPAERAGREPRV